MNNALFSLKMRASQGARHISGAEKLLPPEKLGEFAAALIGRALTHANGEPDAIRLRCEAIVPGELREYDALPVSAVPCGTVEAGLAELTARLAADGIGGADRIVGLLAETAGMRGAIVYDVDAGRRIEPDSARGVRATYMDADSTPALGPDSRKNHFTEAIVLATKVAHAPHLIGELCISDDPDYTTGYYASPTQGYVRIANLKPKGSPRGGRIFLFRGDPAKIGETVAYLEHTPVRIRNVPATPPGAAPVERPDKWGRIDGALETLRRDSLFRQIPNFDSAPGPRVRRDGREYLMLAANNYLGLAADPRVREAASEAALRWGAGSGGSRLTTGDTPPFRTLEARLAEFKHAERALVFNTGYAANTGTVAALCGPGDVIFSDELNHASIIDGCRLSRARVMVYRHRDMRDLEEKIRSVPFSAGLIVSDGVFSMDGDLAPLPEILELAERYNLFSMIDEAHATGTVGATGRGLAEAFGLNRGPDILVGTLSKALGAEGGFVCGSHRLIDFLVNRARSFIFSTALPAPVIAAADRALEILMHEPERVARLRRNTGIFRNALAAAGIRVETASAIVPIPAGEAEIALAAARELAARGVWISPIRYPTVPRGAARLRAALMSEHRPDELIAAANAVAEALKIAGTR